MTILGARAASKAEKRSELIQTYLSLREEWAKKARKFDKRHKKAAAKASSVWQQSNTKATSSARDKNLLDCMLTLCDIAYSDPDDFARGICFYLSERHSNTSRKFVCNSRYSRWRCDANHRSYGLSISS
jgi:hypothetical protein